MFRRWRTVACSAIASALLLAFTLAPAGCSALHSGGSGGGRTDDGQTVTGLEQAVFLQINQYRRSTGLSPLTPDDRLSDQARKHSADMASGAVPFGHDGFAQRIAAAGIPYRRAGENVAYNWNVSDPAGAAVQGWLKSPGHLANITGDYDLTGVGAAVNAEGRYYFTQIFLLRR